MTTYKILAHALKSSPRAIGQALKHNPYAPQVPCHRVIAANYFVGGYHGQWGHGTQVDTKRKLLQSEGIPLDKEGFLREINFIYTFGDIL